MHIVTLFNLDEEHARLFRQSRFWKTITWPWFGPILILVGWGPLFLFDLVIDPLEKRGIVGPHFGVGYGMGWGTLIAVPATIIAVCASLFQLLAVLFRFIRTIYGFVTRR